MKRCIIALSILILLCGCAVFPLFASALKQGESKHTPDWLKRTNFSIALESDEKPTYFFETIQPLFGTQDDDIVLFNQTRIAQKSLRPVYGTGFGARTTFHDKYLLGINTFYDYQDLHRHQRGGVGFEAMDDLGLEVRLNTYLRISKERVVKEEGSNEYKEKVANGLDWELGIPFPFMPYLKAYGGGYWYDFEHFKNKVGWKTRLEFIPVPYSRLNLEMFDDTKRDSIGYRFEGAVTLAFTSFDWDDIIRDLKLAKEGHPKIDLRKKTLDRVIRDFDITVIKSTKSKGTGLTVEGGKSG
jgi:hypothetical protein